MSEKFFSLADAFNTFLKENGVPDGVRESARVKNAERLFYAGCQAFGACLSYIKMAHEGDTPTAARMIKGLFDEIENFVEMTTVEDAERKMRKEREANPPF